MPGAVTDFSPDTPFVLVAAAPAGGDALAPKLYAALRGAGAGFDASGHRLLSAEGPVEACEFSFTVSHAEKLTDLKAALADLQADVAILPLKGRRKALLISDMDSTIIGQECIDEIADFADLKAEIAAITEAAMRGELDFEGALIKRVAMLVGLQADILQRTFDERITLNPGARTLVATMTAHGARTVLVSGGFTFFTSRVAAAAGFGFQRANELLIANGALTGEVARPILGRAAKLDALDWHANEIGVTRNDALALGDGANDLDMICAAGLGIAYKAKPIVAAEARAHIQYTDLTTVLFFQGYSKVEFSVV